MGKTITDLIIRKLQNFLCDGYERFYAIDEARFYDAESPVQAIVVVINGSFLLKLDDRELALKEGECAVIGKYMKISPRSPESELIYFHLQDLMIITEIYSGLEELRRCIYRLADHKLFDASRDRISNYLKELKTKQNTGLDKHYFDAYGQLILLALIELLCGSNEHTVKKNKPLALITTIVSLNGVYPFKDYSRKELAEILEVTPSYISKIIQYYKGLTFKQYGRILKMEYARHLLETTQLTINEVALKCRYPDASYFSTSFKNLYGLSPVALRHQYNEATILDWEKLVLRHKTTGFCLLKAIGAVVDCESMAFGLKRVEEYLHIIVNPYQHLIELTVYSSHDSGPVSLKVPSQTRFLLALFADSILKFTVGEQVVTYRSISQCGLIVV